MAGRVFPLEPREVPKVQTKYRRIVTPIPAPQSLPVLEKLRKVEPHCMEGQPPVVWDHAQGVQVHDRWGNMWLDFSSGVLITNAGHGRKKIIDAITTQAQHGLLTNYCFANEPRALLADKLVTLAPDSLNKVFLLSVGSETVESAIKLARTHGAALNERKIVIVSFEHAFHGRSLGSQQVGGIPELKTWIKNLDPGFVQVPFPDGFRCKDTSFELFEKTLKAKGIDPQDVAGVISETYQGAGASFGPPEYFQQLRKWCDKHQALLIFDEVQAGFGRTGTFWGFEHYGVVPDLMCLGKGISSSLPISALIGRADVMNLYGPGAMTSTHTGNPICCMAALANIELILEEKLTENAAKVGAVMHKALGELKVRFADRIGSCQGKGLVAGLHMVKPGSQEPDDKLAWEVVKSCMEKGLLLFAPVGFGGATIKICPPLCIDQQAVLEAVEVIGQSIEQVLAQEKLVNA